MRTFPAFNLNKRQKFVVVTFLVTMGMIFIRYPFLQWRFRIAGYAISSCLLSLWALHDEDFGGIEWLTLLVLPTLFPVGSALVLPLLPNSFDSFLAWNISADSGMILALGVKMAFLILFAVGFYAVLLTRNIYNISAIHTIQLVRAARSVGFMMVLFTALSFYLVVASLHLNSLFNFLLVFLISFPLALSALWSVNLEEKIGEKVRVLTLFMSLCLAEIGWVLSFWPVSVSLFALVLTAVFYTLIGLGQYFLSEKLFSATVREFVIVLLVVFVLMIFSTSWSG